MAAQSNDPEIERSLSELQNDESSRRQDDKDVITPLPVIEPSFAPVSPEQPRGAWVNRIDRARNRLLLFAATAFLPVAVAMAMFGYGSLARPQGVLTSSQSGATATALGLLAMIAIFLFPFGLLAPLGVLPRYWSWMLGMGDGPSPVVLPLYCLICLAYFSLPLVGSFPAPRRRRVFVASYLIFVVMLVTNIAGCASIVSRTGP